MFGIIPTTPPNTPASDTESDPSEDPSSDHIPSLPATSPFLSSTNDTTDNDTPDTPSSPTHDTPFIEITASTQRSPIIPYRRVMLLAHGQPIPHGRPYRYHLNGPVHMMTARKRVGPFPTHHLVVIYSVDYSFSDHFSLDDSSRDSSSISSSETSSDSFTDALSDSASSRSSSDHSLTGPSSALSSTRADLLPSHKRIRSPESATDLEVSLAEGSEPSRYRGTKLEMDDDVKRSDGIDIDPEIQAKIDECIAYADALRYRGINARFVIEAVDREEIKMGARGPVEVRVDRVTHPVIADDIPEPAQEERVIEVTYKTLGDL
ncbi:hypothetical protein Tco_1037045, partial [Tanacetum coccineum]